VNERTPERFVTVWQAATPVADLATALADSMTAARPADDHHRAAFKAFKRGALEAN
jgi:hypothetical protein